jgi:hypothetical protein
MACEQKPKLSWVLHHAEPYFLSDVVFNRVFFLVSFRDRIPIGGCACHGSLPHDATQPDLARPSRPLWPARPQRPSPPPARPPERVPRAPSRPRRHSPSRPPRAPAWPPSGAPARPPCGPSPAAPTLSPARMRAPDVTRVVSCIPDAALRAPARATRSRVRSPSARNDRFSV